MEKYPQMHERESRAITDRKDRPDEPINLEEETEFPRLMRGFRERDKRSLNNLAYEVGVDPSYLTRIEHGNREPPRRHVVEALGRGLKLTLEEKNRLLASAGYAPLTSVDRESAPVVWNDTFQAVADVLNSHDLPDEAKASFRKIVGTVAQMWLSNGDRSNGRSE